ncbi:hypothetical protein RirG_246580 [Rhizophagus irregularis DAOM 197198w]|uniref:Replication origin-binding protein domain-containing protein n=1 Tax=Rhizophagus irregularis (strain DAOM 197198w) TaxID=1432141 RepID=A0A015LEE0_RHIIW|nr:hypothetical protein RirG_246580 [Rhizophagus irregularis DAOM 197198w]
MQGDLSINERDIVQVESLFHIKFSVRPFVAILDEANAIMRQISSSTNARESENAMHDVLRSARHILAMDAFANKSILAFLKIYRGEGIYIIDNRYQPRGKRVAFISTGAVMARALVEKASKLFKSDNSPSELDCIAYTNTVETGISFEVTGHFDIVIAITNIATPVHVKALAQMLYRIRDCPRRIVSLFYQKNSNELFYPPGHENIWAELTSARPNNLPIAIKGHREWNNNTISYKVDESPAVITFIEVEHQKRLSARYFIEKLCSLIVSTVRVEALVIKETDFNAVTTSQNLSLEKAEVLKFDQERSIADTIVLKCFYMQNLYCKDMNIEDWNNICNRKFVENFSSPKARKHFLRLFYFRRQGYDEENAIKGLKAEENIQWEIACYRAEENLEKSVAEDLRKSYSANHWKVIQELFQILGLLSLSLFGFKSHAKTTPDLNLTIKAINAIAGPKGQQVWQYSYRINCQPYNSTGFGDKGAPELSPYRLKTDNDIQELFDSIGQEK